MTTLSANYPDAVRVRRVPEIAKICILASLILIAILVLGMIKSASQVDLTSRAAISLNSSPSVVVPVPTAPLPEIQPVPSVTPALPSGDTGASSVVPIPVPTPPAQ